MKIQTLEGSDLNVKIISFYLVLKDKFRLEPRNDIVVKGKDAHFDCLPPKGFPEPTTFWRRGGDILSPEQGPR